MKKIIGLMAAVAMLVGMMAGPAAADKTEVGAFNGVANVGDSFDKPCTQQGDATATGKGLYLPLVNDHDGTYSLHTDLLVSVPNGLGTLDVCGFLTIGQGLGIGASCGSSSGFGGTGKVTWPSKAGNVYLLKNVGWAQSVGGTLPVQGDIEEAVVGTKTRTTKSAGRLVAVVQAQGGSECAEQKPADGATQFNVAGTFTASNTVPLP